MKNLLKKPVFAKGNAKWISELSSFIKQYNFTIHSSVKMKPIQASKKQLTKKSIPISKTIEKFENQNSIYVDYLKKVLLKKFLVRVIQQIGVIIYI